MPQEEKRKFTRIPFDALAEIKQDDMCWKERLIDLSLKGLLVSQPPEWPDNPTGSFDVVIHLNPTAKINMQVTYAHSENNHVGFFCDKIDIDSISHLRRLIELNMGSEEILERELSALG